MSLPEILATVLFFLPPPKIALKILPILNEVFACVSPALAGLLHAPTSLKRGVAKVMSSSSETAAASTVFLFIRVFLRRLRSVEKHVRQSEQRRRQNNQNNYRK